MVGRTTTKALVMSSLVLAAATLTACGGSSGSSGGGSCESAALAYVGTINGANAALGVNILNGAKLAVKEHNDANKDCQVTLKEFDTEGTPDKATGIVTQVASDKSIIGVLGLPFSGESKATGSTFEQARLVHITPSATNPDLTNNGWKTFFRGLGNDAVQGPAAAKYLTENLKANKICVVQDDSDYGIGLGTQVSKALGAKSSCQDKVKTKQTDFSAVVGKIIGEKPDAVYYAGYYQEGAPFAQQLIDKGFKGKLVAPDGVKDEEYVKGAGDAGAQTIFTCPCVPAENFTEFNDAYKKQFNKEPGTYSVEGYDATKVLLKGIDEGNRDRAKLMNYVKSYDGAGLSRKFKWDDKGELTDTPVWTYKVESGKIVKDVEVK